ncbi:MAG: transcription elongation factor GreA [Parcubacteria group bacterium]|nr:transcription elongation factor GreA [Parcubacteria group bacterium]
MHYISAQGLERLKAEIAHLKTVKRQEVAERLQRAKELGDLSENSEYQEAKEEQALMEKRIAELEQELKDTVIIEQSEKSGVVAIGNTVEVRTNGTKRTFTIVGSAEANPKEGHISNESPLGKAFLGRPAGERIVVDTPGGKVTYTILSIL